jgi:hypothetical protein
MRKTSLIVQPAAAAKVLGLTIRPSLLQRADHSFCQGLHPMRCRHAPRARRMTQALANNGLTIHGVAYQLKLA